MKSSTKDNAEGKMHQVKGKVNETVGNQDLEADGKVENLHVKVQANAAMDIDDWPAGFPAHVADLRN